jgi:thioredoxin-dependent peroxiredoxin
MRLSAALLAPLAALTLAAIPSAAIPALPVGASAPDFTTRGALAGHPFRLNLREQLRQGPVVLYFFPRAFTQGCTLEANAFSESVGEFRALGARVIGLSADDYETLARFSVEECRNAFPVATATPATIRAYDVRLSEERPEMSNRTSYVIAPDGRILHVHSDPDWREHVASTLAAVRAWHARQR